MRELKFRAWDKKRKIMYYNVSFDANYISPQCVKSADIDVLDFVRKSDCVIMQYTGLKDKNGKEVYEGDIVYWEHLGKEDAVEIYFNLNEFVFVGKPVNSVDETESWLSRNCIYLGNIYENTELLSK